MRIGTSELMVLLVCGVVPVVIFFALGFLLGRSVGFKRGLQEASKFQNGSR